MARSRHVGQSALARDVEGWHGGRRWGHGRPRFPGTGREAMPEEGYNERGEAPPPYMPALLEAAAQPGGTHQQSGEGQAIPLQDMSSDGRKPPDYVEPPLLPQQFGLTPPAHHSIYQ